MLFSQCLLVLAETSFSLANAGYFLLKLVGFNKILREPNESGWT